jgi:integrase
MAGVDTTTRYQGVFARHREGCRVEEKLDCNCTPSYFGTAWDRRAHRTRKTRHFRLVSQAKEARTDLQDAVRKGEAPMQQSTVTLGEVRDQFAKAAKDGVALNKHRRPYKPSSAEDLESSLDHLPDEMLRKRAVRITKGEIQALVDRKSSGPKRLSGSRISSIVNAIRSMYAWAEQHEYANFDPAKEIRLPANDAKPRDEVVSPPEFSRLISSIYVATPAEIEDGKARGRDEARKDALPYALAGYAGARKQEIKILDWSHLNLELGAGELAGDEEGRKPGGSWRVVFFVKPLWDMLREEWEAQGRPSSGLVCPPKAKRKSGRISLNALQRRVAKRWRDLDLKPTGLHQSRHTFVTWLDHAGVSPKVASEITGHKTPTYQPGAAPITLRVYTHMLPGELERARDQLDTFINERMHEQSIESKEEAA